MYISSLPVGAQVCMQCIYKSIANRFLLTVDVEWILWPQLRRTVHVGLKPSCVTNGSIVEGHWAECQVSRISHDRHRTRHVQVHMAKSLLWPFKTFGPLKMHNCCENAAQIRPSCPCSMKRLFAHFRWIHINYSHLCVTIVRPYEYL